MMTATGRPLAADGRFVAVAVAAHLTGVPPRTLRRWAADGHVPAKDGQRGRLVDLDAVRLRAELEGYSAATPGQPVASTRPDMATGHQLAEDGQQPAGQTRPPATNNGSELARVIDRLTRENVELAGRVGFLQSEVLHLKARIALLDAPPAATIADPPETAESSRSNRSGGPENAAVRGVQSERSGPSRPWWRTLAGWLR